MKTIKTYLVKYAVGIINPVEKSIEIECIYTLDEEYIKREIYTRRPNEKGQIMAIFDTLLIKESPLEEKKENIKKEDKSLPTFNW